MRGRGAFVSGRRREPGRLGYPPHGLRTRQPSGVRRLIGLGKAVRQQPFDLGLRLSVRGSDQLTGILGRQLGRQQPSAREMQVARPDGHEQLGQLARAASDPDAEVGDRLGEVQGVDAVAKQGGVALSGVESPSIDLTQVSEEIGLERVGASGELAEAHEELVVGEAAQGIGHG
ncbi:MAG: hypothetical protein ABFS46_13470 [Myxococcota bacterium]